MLTCPRSSAGGYERLLLAGSAAARGGQVIEALCRRSHQGATSGTVALTGAQLSMLLEGIDWRRPTRTFDPQLAV
jgi:transposase